MGAYRRAKRDRLGVNGFEHDTLVLSVAIAFQYTERQYVEK